MSTLHLLMTPGAIEQARASIHPEDQVVTFDQPQPIDLVCAGQFLAYLTDPIDHPLAIHADRLADMIAAASRVETW